MKQSTEGCACLCVCVLLQGFEPRGTYIGVRQSRLFLLQENAGPGKTLSHLPQHLNQRLKHTHCYKAHKSTLLLGHSCIFFMPYPLSGTGGSNGDGSRSSSKGQDLSGRRLKRMLAADSSPDTFLCDSPGAKIELNADYSL